MRHAIFTVVQDEPFFFPLWHKYYREHYESKHMYVLYHPLPTEETVQSLRLHSSLSSDTNLVRIFRDKSFDHTWLRQQVERFAGFLIGSYDTVTFTEVDEIITLDPTKVMDRNLSRWLDAWCRRGDVAVCCQGYEVVHRFSSEPDLEPGVQRTDGRVLEHRSWWYPSNIYSKTLTWRVQPHWNNGFHQAYLSDGNTPLDLPRDPDLLLLHLHKVDYNTALARLHRTAARNWNEADRQAHIGLQNRFQDEAHLQEWWYKDIDDPSLGAALVPMPALMRDVV